MSVVDEQLTVFKENDDRAWPYRITGLVTHINSHKDGFLVSEDELRHLRDEANKLLGDSPFQAGYNLAVANHPNQVYVDEAILDALLDAKSITTMEYAVKAYLKERGVVLT